VSPAVIGHEAQEDFAAEALTTVTQPTPTPSVSPEPLPPVPHGPCVNCGRDVMLRVVATEGSRRTYQWVPDDETPRRGRYCSEGSLPAYHWAAAATAAVYHVST
jgi:hypothetical protein